MSGKKFNFIHLNSYLYLVSKNLSPEVKSRFPLNQMSGEKTLIRIYHFYPCLQLLLCALPISRATPTVCWKSVNKDALYEFHWLFQLQSFVW